MSQPAVPVTPRQSKLSINVSCSDGDNYNVKK